MFFFNFDILFCNHEKFQMPSNLYHQRIFRKFHDRFYRHHSNKLCHCRNYFAKWCNAFFQGWSGVQNVFVPNYRSYISHIYHQLEQNHDIQCLSWWENLKFSQIFPSWKKDSFRSRSRYNFFLQIQNLRWTETLHHFWRLCIRVRSIFDGENKILGLKKM